MIVFDKKEIRKALTPQDIFHLLVEWGGEPEYTSFGILSSTICHNKPGEGSRKCYYYTNTLLFHCYTGCEDPSFDIFQLAIKVYAIQYNREIDLNEAVKLVAQKCGISGTYQQEENEKLEDWEYLDNYKRIQEIEYKVNNILLKEYAPCPSTESCVGNWTQKEPTKPCWKNLNHKT